MFEVLFILTTLDAGTRVGRFMLQDLLAQCGSRLGNMLVLPDDAAVELSRRRGLGLLSVQGVNDPLGGVNILWPLFGIANQLLAGIALTVATGILIKMDRLSTPG